MPNVLNLVEVAEYLRVHPSTIYRMLKRRQIPAFKVGTDWRFNSESIDRWRLGAEDLATTAEKAVLAGGLRVVANLHRPMR
jgi:excisionase family DNA binding protein